MNAKKIAHGYRDHVAGFEKAGKKPFGLRKFIRHELKVHGVRYPSPASMDWWANSVKLELNKLKESQTENSPVSNEIPSPEKSVFPDWMVKEAERLDRRYRAMLPDY